MLLCLNLREQKEKEVLKIKKIVIIGAGGFAREVGWLIQDINEYNKQWDLLGYIDDDKEKKGLELNGLPVLGGIEWLKNHNEKEIYVVCAIGNGEIREQIIKKISNFENIRFPNLIHPSVSMSENVILGRGNIICAGNYITTNISFGDHIIVNLNCTIGHDVEVDDFVTILPGVNISGNVHLKKGCNLGTGTAIIQGLSIGEMTTIGAGSVVVKDIPSNCTAVGIPAKPIKYHLEE